MVGPGIEVSADKAKITMVDDRVYRSAQLNYGFQDEVGIQSFSYSVKVTGVSGGWLYAGLAQKVENYDRSCFFDIDYSFGFGLNTRELCTESYRSQKKHFIDINDSCTITLNVDFKNGKIWILADGKDLDISIVDPKLKSGGTWYPTFLLHKKNQSFEIVGSESVPYIPDFHVVNNYFNIQDDEFNRLCKAFTYFVQAKNQGNLKNLIFGSMVVNNEKHRELCSQIYSDNI